MQYKRIFWLIIRFVIICILCSIFTYLAIKRLKLQGHLYGIDDANIFFVYAKNFAAGHGFVYNIGGEHVEGFTSLLWVLIASVAFAISNIPEYFLLILNIITLSFTLTFVTLYLDKVINPVQKLYSISFVSLIFLSITITSPRYITWVTFTLMDVGIWSALLVILTILLLKADSIQQMFPMNIFIFLLLLTRPEAILWSLVFIILGGLKVLILYDRKQAFRSIKFLLTTYCITMICLTIFRISYFGYPFPNTYYAKVSPNMIYNLIEGIKYLRQYVLISDPWASLGILCSGIQTLFIILNFYNTYCSIRKVSCSLKTFNQFCLVIITWTGLFIPVITGGDHFSSHRFYQAIYPILILNIIYLGIQIIPTINYLYIFSDQYKSLKLLILSGIVLLFPLMSQNVSWSYFSKISGIQNQFVITQEGRELGTVLTEFFAKLPKYPTIGTIVAGGIKFTYQGPIFDLMGLNNIAMGHSQGNRKGVKNHAAFEKDVFLTFPPDIVTPTIDNLKQQPFYYNPMEFSQSWDNQNLLKELYDDYQFQQLYQYVRISTNSSNKTICGFCHRRFLSYIIQNPYYKVEFAEKCPISSH